MVFPLFVRVGLSEFKTQILQHGQHGARRGDAHQPWFMFVQILADGPTIGFLSQVMSEFEVERFAGS